MADKIQVLADREDIVAVADAVRNKTGTSGEMTLGEIASSINGISAGTELPELTNEGSAADLLLGKELINSDGEVIEGTFTIDSELTMQDDLITQIQTALEGKAAGSEPVLQSKTVSPNRDTQIIKPDSGYNGLDSVTVNPIPLTYVVPSGTTYIKSNGVHSVSGYANANVDVPASSTHTVTFQHTSGVHTAGTIHVYSVDSNHSSVITNLSSNSYPLQLTCLSGLIVLMDATWRGIVNRATGDANATLVASDMYDYTRVFNITGDGTISI